VEVFDGSGERLADHYKLMDVFYISLHNYSQPRVSL